MNFKSFGVWMWMNHSHRWPCIDSWGLSPMTHVTALMASSSTFAPFLSLFAAFRPVLLSNTSADAAARQDMQSKWCTSVGKRILWHSRLSAVTLFHSSGVQRKMVEHTLSFIPQVWGLHVASRRCITSIQLLFRSISFDLLIMGIIHFKIIDLRLIECNVSRHLMACYLQMCCSLR